MHSRYKTGMTLSERELRARQASSFGAAAAEYERGRPGYPEAAIDWLLPQDPGVVVDLGAGTGKLTRQLAARGLEVIAVEPSDGMRAQLQEVLPGVRALGGSAEAIPLPDASVGAVVVAQAWHWVDVPRASVEVARVLAPGGRLALVWNMRNARVDWVQELSRITAGGVEAMDRANPDVGPPFGPVEHHRVEWAAPMTPDALVDLVASRSYIITATEEERESRLEEVRKLIGRHPDLAGRAHFDMPYVTYCSRASVG
jgi:SAM-dependent methyltransferase